MNYKIKSDQIRSDQTKQSRNINLKTKEMAGDLKLHIPEITCFCLLILTVPDGNGNFPKDSEIPKFPKFHHIPLPPTSLSHSLFLSLH